jgi:single-stranded DNA-binding protein
MNHWSLIGELCANPETKFAASGTCIATFYIGVNDYKGVEHPVKIAYIGKAAEKAAEELNRGDLVVCQGKIEPHEYNGKIYADLKITDIQRLDDKGHAVKDETIGHDDINTGADDHSDLPF